MGRLAETVWMGNAEAMRIATERRHSALVALGFRPAYFDYATGQVHLARHADGSPSTEHVVDGLPDEAVAVRAGSGQVVAAKATLVAGFERRGFFYTRRSAWRAAKEWGQP